MTKIQKLLALYGAYAKSVNAHLTALAAWAVFMLHSGNWPPTRDEWALLITLAIPGTAAAISTNKPLDPSATTFTATLDREAITSGIGPMEPAFPPPVGD